MSKRSFVFPGRKTKSNPAGRGGYPIPDLSHARNALARVSQFGSPSEKATVRRKVTAKFPALAKRSRARNSGSRTASRRGSNNVAYHVRQGVRMIGRTAPKSVRIG